MKPQAGKLQEADWPLIHALAADGRATYRQLADRTHWHESTVRRRMDELTRSGALYFDLDVASDALGVRSRAILWMSVAPPAWLKSARPWPPRGRTALRSCHHRGDKPGGLAWLGRRSAVPVPDQRDLRPRWCHSHRDDTHHAVGEDARHHARARAHRPDRLTRSRSANSRPEEIGGAARSALAGLSRRTFQTAAVGLPPCPVARSHVVVVRA